MKTKKFIISFVVSILVFSIASVIIAMGLSQGRRNDRKTDSLNNEELEGRSVNILLVMSDYSPEKFNDYDPDWVRNVVGKSVEFPVVKPESPLNGYRKVYTENMAIL